MEQTLDPKAASQGGVVSECGHGVWEMMRMGPRHCGRARVKAPETSAVAVLVLSAGSGS